MTDDDLLRREVRFLGELLGQTARDLEGDAAFQLIEEIRHLAKYRRRGDAAAARQLAVRVRGMDEPGMAAVVRAFTIYFDLANLAEDRQRARKLRERRLADPDRPQKESIADAFATLKAGNVSAAEIRDLLDKLHVEMVFTAHPTEAKRRTVRNKLRSLRRGLAALDAGDDLLPAEKATLERGLRAEIGGLWQSEFVRPRRPTVLEEVQRGLSFAPTLWEVAPRVVEDLRSAVAATYPDLAEHAPAFLTFGSWIGGDRDGHPDVTAEVTARTLRHLRETALDRHLERAEQARSALSMSSDLAAIDPAVEAAAADAERRWPELQPALAAVSPNEAYRRLLTATVWRLKRTRASELGQPLPAGAYANADELRAELEVIAASLARHGGAAPLDEELRAWLAETRVFGFRFACLDVRQVSGVYAAALAEILERLKPGSSYLALDEAGRAALLAETRGVPLPAGDWSPAVAETLALFRTMVDAVLTWGTDALGGHVISMTRAASDVLAPRWFWEHAAAAAGAPELGPVLRTIPLFETIQDLRDAGKTLDAILGNPWHAATLAPPRREQVVMVGYSDSTKDGGYLAATWALQTAQSELAAVALRHGARLVLFHGRGGALGRGGGPAARGILSLPPESVGGALRMTEQGEVLAERYDDPRIAQRHLEQVTWATALVTARPGPAPPRQWLDAMAEMSAAAFAAYRELVEQPGFIDFFVAATPIGEIEQLAIGSRPARRGGGLQALADLRAIPWVFAWTQARYILPAWYGLGTALAQFAAEHADGAATLKAMYAGWPYFQATLDNAALALAKTDLAIAEEYANLVEDDDLRQRVWGRIAAERDRSEAAVLAALGAAELLADIPWLRKSLIARNPYVDPLNLIQVELFRRLRKETAQPTPSDDRVAALRQLLRMTVKGIAAGMRTTG